MVRELWLHLEFLEIFEDTQRLGKYLHKNILKCIRSVKLKDKSSLADGLIRLSVFG